MARILITSGPTREYLDPVRYLTNASSGRMGAALASAAIAAGNDVVVVSGPVDISYPSQAEVISIVSTQEMLTASQKAFLSCDGFIAVAAPCDYRPVLFSSQKMRRTGGPLTVHLVETPDVVAHLAEVERSQWLVGFALETEDEHMRALQKLERKSCDLIVVNGPEAIHAMDTSVEIMNKQGEVLGSFVGSKKDVAVDLFRIIEKHLLAF